MIALLDPVLFVPPVGHPIDERALEREIEGIRELCRQLPADLVDIDDYWPPLWSELVEPLRRRLQTRDAQRAVTELRKMARRDSGQSGPAPSGRVWGFRPMFGRTTLLPDVWEDRMGRAVLRALSSGRDVILVVKRVVDRNIRRHQAGDVVIDEVTRWRLYVQPHTPKPVAVPCVWSPRQVRIPWTTRFDPRLPCERDGARYPFCPPEEWWKRATNAVRTIESKPAWSDRHGNGWTRPNVAGGSGYHWDVFLRDSAHAAALGVDQVNVVQFGAPPHEGHAGHLHHVPTEKQARVRDVGWNCP